MTKFKPARATLIASLLIAGTAFAGPAQAATSLPPASDTAGQTRVLTQVFNAADRSAAANALSASDKALLAEAETHQSGQTKLVRSGRLPAGTVLANNGAPSPEVAAAGLRARTRLHSLAAGGCWYQFWSIDWYDLTIYEGTTWMQANWCGNGSSITSYSVSNIGGQGSRVADYTGTVGNPGALNVGWEVRQYVEYAFNFGFMTANPCMQIRGGASGLYGDRRTCNLG